MSAEFDEYFMRMALREAEKAAADGEVPAGCVIVEEPESDDMPPSAVRVRILKERSPGSAMEADRTDGLPMSKDPLPGQTG